ncbi:MULTISPECIES: permease-like cell division protein FtsX [Turicibacter]|jgi:efflux ABC transporter, permease protein|uniref:Cell division protein FtsX n=2 Tax=Turicibacter sanguinis TaxID=154288 RepID=A0A173RDJ2_9FIRM|nr:MULTISPECIES: permease-like cell division protein FtsX [Turicibacter]EFF63847.1 efflux ABC transporter, permease protein [Turicibacter sanguinis PC909]EGC93456.1 efflux ABC transporter, permease protein [Turicibacter sp. HGF1]MBP3902752.1 FtsX-like permease family protein [Turicibacter sp.]MCU7191541.1 permease-like cell division protein FtsX [Turicibacter sanguinis]MCU7195453.1 permease-like cell division protein FtsX [Turicibacter sanguinis]
MMLIRQLFRYIRDGLKNIWRNLFMSISSIFTLTITLSLCSLFVLFAHNSNEFTEQLENEIKIFVEFDKVATPEQIQSTIDTIEQNSYVVDVEYTTKEQNYQDFIDRIGNDDPELAVFFENTSDENPLVGTLVVSADAVNHVDQVAKEIKEMSNISYVDYGEESSLAAFANITKMIRESFSWIVVVLLVLAVFLIQNTIKLTIYARKNELKIMKLVGASATHVTVPFLVEGLIIGVLGAIGPILFTVFGYQYLYELFGGVLVIPMFQLTAPLPLVYTLSFGIGIISIAISLIGSFFAVIRYSLKI